MTENGGSGGGALSTHELWSLREDVHLELEPAGASIRLETPWGKFTIPQPSPEVREALSRMRLGPVSLDNIPGIERGDYDRSAHRRQLDAVLERLQPLIIRSLRLTTGQPLLSVIPLTPRSAFHPAALSPDAPVRLSAFAGLRTDGREYRLESPLALHRVLLHRAEAVQLIGKLGSPTAPDEVTTALPSARPVAEAALEYLVAVGMVSQAEAPAAGGQPVFSEDRDLALAGWSPGDLAFHASSTIGRHDHACGATYPMDDAGVTWSGEPAVKPTGDRPAITLYRPRWEDLCAADPPLTVAVEGRRSVRDHGGEPVTVTELGELLYRTFRVRRLTEPQDPSALAPRVLAVRELSDRPYPGGGACYELEGYLTVDRCAGLARGVYHYDPLGHLLEPVSSDPALVEELLSFARSGANMAGRPQVLITLTARIRRLSWKYEGLPYRLALIDAGVLVQNLSLVCTAMQIASCAIGGVNSDLSARAFGADWRTEPAMVQFIVGRAAAADDDHQGIWRAANDGDWADRARARLGAGRAGPPGA